MAVSSSKVGAINSAPVRWKNDSLIILQANTGTWITSPDIFNSIFKDSEKMPKEERRKKMINISIALGSLVEEGLAISEPNEGGRGLRYTIAQKTKIPA